MAYGNRIVSVSMDGAALRTLYSDAALPTGVLHMYVHISTGGGGGGLHVHAGNLLIVLRLCVDGV